MLVIVGFVAAAIASAWTLARIFQGFSASNKYEKLKVRKQSTNQLFVISLRKK